MPMNAFYFCKELIYNYIESRFTFYVAFSCYVEYVLYDRKWCVIIFSSFYTAYPIYSGIRCELVEKSFRRQHASAATA